MRQRDNTLNTNNKFLHRPRLDALLEKGLEKSLIIVTAGSGYGKTQTLASFFQNRKERVAWVSLTKHDNITTYFWDNFVSSLKEVTPKIAESMEQIGFPDSISKFEAGLRYLTKEIYSGEKLVFVVDDCDNIYNRDVQHFYESIVEADIENFCLILMSSTKIAFNPDFDKVLHISTQDLAFTKKEAADFFKLCNVNLSHDTFSQIFSHTEGWPMALGLFVEQYYNQQDLFSNNMNIPVITEMFEKNYFSSFSKETKTLLVKLSFFRNFFSDMPEALNRGNSETIVNDLMHNTFISHDSSAKLFKFQKMYFNFLEEKQVLLSEEQIIQNYSLAGDYFLEKGLHFQAIDCYFKSREYDKFLHTLAVIPKKRRSKEYCENIIKYLNALPAEFIAQNDFVEFSKGFFLLNNMEVKKAKEIFLKIKKKFEGKDLTELDQFFLGETYLVLADISVLLGEITFAEYYKKAAEFLPSGSKIRHKKLMFLGNAECFFLPTNQPGMLEKTLELVFESKPYAEMVTNGSGQGYALLYTAEAAFLTYDLPKAEHYAMKSVYNAFSTEQHDIICNAYFLLARIALAKGDYDGAEKQVQKVISYVKINSLTDLFELVDCIESWFNIIIGDLDKLPNWVVNHKDSYYAQYPIDAGRSSIIYAMYLMARDEHAETNNVLTQMEDIFSQKILWALRLSSYLMRAVCFYREDDEENTVKYFEKAYDMAYHNNITMPFIEFGKIMNPLIDIAKNSSGYNFDVEWLEEINKKIAAYEINCSKFIREHYRENRIEAIPENTLSVEEFEVLKLLAQGKTIKEIQHYKNISLSEAKKITVDIFIKLGAVNKFDAIRIAKSRKYI